MEELKAELHAPAAGAEEIRYENLSPGQLGQLLDLRKQVGMTDPEAPEKLKRYLESARTYEGVLQKPEEGGIVAAETAVSPEGRLIGYGTAEVFSWVPFDVEVKEIAVEPGRQGSGIGRELFGRLLSKVQRIPRLASIYVTDLSGTGRTGAIARSFGFNEVSPIGSTRSAYPQYILELNTAGAEEGVAVFQRVQEMMEGFRSVSAADSKAVVVIGLDVAQRFLGLQVLAGLEERVVIDRGEMADTLTRVVQRGDVAYFYGDPERGKLLEELAGRAGLEELTVVLRDPAAQSTVRLALQQILMDLRIPAEAISAGLEELAASLEELGQAA